MSFSRRLIQFRLHQYWPTKTKKQYAISTKEKQKNCPS